MYANFVYLNTLDYNRNLKSRYDNMSTDPVFSFCAAKGYILPCHHKPVAIKYVIKKHESTPQSFIPEL